MYYIIFLSLGILSGIVQFFIERGILRKILVSISLISFIGLGVIGYLDGIRYNGLQSRVGGLQNQLSAAEASSSALESQTEQLKNQVFSPSPKTQVIIVSSKKENNDIFSTELSFGIGTVAGANMPTLTSISPPAGIVCEPLSGSSDPGFTGLGPLAGLMQRDWTTNCTSTGPIPQNSSFGMSYK